MMVSTESTLVNPVNRQQSSQSQSMSASSSTTTATAPPEGGGDAPAEQTSNTQASAGGHIAADLSGKNSCSEALKPTPP